jgi:chromosomal replication initiator protein
MSEAKAVSIDTIKRMCAATFGVTLNDLVSHRRNAAMVRARYVAIYLARQLTPYSLPQIAFHFGKRDHTTIMYAISRVDRWIDVDGHLAIEVAGLLHAMVPGRQEMAA